MKRITLLLAIATAFALAGCAKKEEEEKIPACSDAAVAAMDAIVDRAQYFQSSEKLESKLEYASKTEQACRVLKMRMPTDTCMHKDKQTGERFKISKSDFRSTCERAEAYLNAKNLPEEKK